MKFSVLVDELNLRLETVYKSQWKLFALKAQTKQFFFFVLLNHHLVLPEIL